MAKKTSTKTLEQLQEEHSEMCATAADLGVRVPEDLTIDFDTAEVGATVVSALDALIRKFREGTDEVVAEDEKKEDTASVDEKPTAAKKKSKPKKQTEAKTAEATTGEEQVTATAKKVAAKKPAKKGKATAKKTAAAKPNGIDEDAKITWASGKENPAREGSGRHGRIESVRKASGKTVKTYLAAKGNPQTLRNCVKAKLCTVA